MVNQYPLWKYVLIFALVVLGVFYSLPNFYGEDPAVQMSPSRGGPLDEATRSRIEQAFKGANLPYVSVIEDAAGTKFRFKDTDTQLRARDLALATLGQNYTVALNLLPATPGWFSWFNAKPKIGRAHV